jgi:hypothetical protein
MSNSLILNVNSFTKSELSSVSQQFVSQVKNGDVEAIDVLIKAKALEEISKEIQSGVKNYAIEEAQAYGKEGSKRMGVGIVVANGASKYSYDHDETWSELNKEMEILKAKIKEREKSMVEAIKYGGQLITADGEIIPAAVVVSYGEEQVRVSIPK